MGGQDDWVQSSTIKNKTSSYDSFFQSLRHWCVAPHHGLRMRRA